MKTFLIACLFSGTFISAALGQNSSSPAQLLSYDAKQPLGIRTAATYDRPSCTVTDLTYTSPRGGRVGAYLVVPKAPGKSAGILFGQLGQWHESRVSTRG